MSMGEAIVMVLIREFRCRKEDIGLVSRMAY